MLESKPWVPKGTQSIAFCANLCEKLIHNTPRSDTLSAPLPLPARPCMEYGRSVVRLFKSQRSGLTTSGEEIHSDCQLSWVQHGATVILKILSQMERNGNSPLHSPLPAEAPALLGTLTSSRLCAKTSAPNLAMKVQCSNARTRHTFTTHLLFLQSFR
jgi:hypothetical protein